MAGPAPGWNLRPSKFSVDIISEPGDVMPLVKQARAAADTDKKALGFLPGSAFMEAAIQGKLLIAVVRRSDSSVYAGHLLHGGVFPHAKIFQVFTAPHLRRHGVGRRLVEEIVRRAENGQFMSVVARVADDLEANAFWERLGFELVRRSQGGRTTGRQINVRMRELDTPTLFRATAASEVAPGRGLNLESRLLDISPTYVLDLNVLFDLLKKRANAAYVGRIVRAGLNNLIRLAVTDELIRELERNSKPSPTDPVLQFALNLPQLHAPSPEIVKRVVAELEPIIFPASCASGRLRTQDQSDLVHLATAIHYRASGFVTGEKAILRARPTLLARHSLDVVGPSELADTAESANVPEEQRVRASSGGQEVQARPVRDDDVPLIERFLGRLGCPPRLASEVLHIDPTGRRHRIVVLCGKSLVGFGSWEAPSEIRPLVRMFICVDEDHSAVGLAADFLLASVAKSSTADFPVQLSLRLLPGHVATKRIAAAHGFRTSVDDPSNSTDLQKVALGRVLVESNWASLRQRLARGTGLHLPVSMPLYRSPDQVVPVGNSSGGRSTVPLLDLETLLSPAIFLLPGRPGAIVPIRKVYAEDLIGGARQLRLLSSPEAALLRERVYFSDPRTAAILTKGKPVLFYESGSNGGSASAIAVARISRSELVSKGAGLPRDLLRRGVLDEKGVERVCSAGIVAASAIDNILHFRTPVCLARLRALGAVDRANLVTARALEGKQITQIIEEGML